MYFFFFLLSPSMLYHTVRQIVSVVEVHTILQQRQYSFSDLTAIKYQERLSDWLVSPQPRIHQARGVAGEPEDAPGDPPPHRV